MQTGLILWCYKINLVRMINLVCMINA